MGRVVHIRECIGEVGGGDVNGKRRINAPCRVLLERIVQCLYINTAAKWAAYPASKDGRFAFDSGK